MKFSFTTAALGVVALVGLVRGMPVEGTSDLAKRDPPSQYFTVQAPPENISPQADAAAKSLQGLVHLHISSGPPYHPLVPSPAPPMPLRLS